MANEKKRGSSRRQGDEYQDLTALRIALEHYIARKPFEMYLEYKKAGSLDDIVLFQEANIRAYQVKHAVNRLAVYGPNDLADSKRDVYLKKFADSWRAIREKYPNHCLSVYLCTNRSLDAALVDLVTPDGAFTREVIEDRRRKEAKETRTKLASASGLDDDAFRQFLTDFHFKVRQPSLPDLEQYIQAILLDQGLGIYDVSIFLELKKTIEDNTFFSNEPITIETIDKILERLRGRLLISQVFQVEHEHYVEQKALTKQLNDALSQVDGGYLIVTGPPGSGKSTSLTTYFKSLDQTTTEVFSYYCFVDVNDNEQKIRVQAESLRANLLNEFHRRYPDVIKRRFDDTLPNFLKCLKTLADYFVKQNRRFVIFLDGLDHAERLESEVRDNVIATLSPNVPEGVAIVVGTQELHMWPHFLKRLREFPDTHIKMPLFTIAETQDYLVNKRGISGLSNTDIVHIHRKCEGLPLYLRYVAKIIMSSGTISDAIASLSPAADGDIRNYYGLLWEEFDRRGMGNARHLCAVMSCLRFSVYRNELYKIQKSLGRPDFEDAYKCMSHLLREFDERLAIFHNSFREFAIGQLGKDWIQEIKASVVDYLKTREDSPPWFGYVFEYCYETSDYEYILSNVNAEFVERALLRFRPSEEIMSAFHWAVESAYVRKDIIQLSRLGPLKYRTGERFKYNLDRAILADALLALGRDQDVIAFAYSPETDRWVVNSSTALSVLLALAENGELEIGQKLFRVFMNEFRGIHSDDENETGDSSSQIISIARCLGIFSDSHEQSLEWLSQFKFTPRIIDPIDSYAPGYAPHLAAYVDALVQFGHSPEWNRLKHENKYFPNDLVCYLLIRALARHGQVEDLFSALVEYEDQEKPRGNVELAYYAAKAGMPSPKVTEIAGLIETPELQTPRELRLMTDPVLWKYAYSFVILGFENNISSYRNLLETTGTQKTLWSCTIRHLLKACFCIGQSFRNDVRDWYVVACESIDILVKAEHGDGERIVELVGNLKELLQFTVGCLTEEILKRYPDRLDAWMEMLSSLRDSLTWNRHFGISEHIQDFSFELSLWETLAKNAQIRPKLAPILQSCAATYEESTLLKGESRSSHSLRLAATLAKCGMREDAEQWLTYGIRASLTYGYHKDSTLSFLIDAMKLVNQHHPDTALERFARVLWMVKWMPHLSDNDVTRYFTQEVFLAVLAFNRQVALELLKHMSQSTARWKMENCLEEYLLSAIEGDHEYLWCLSELFTNQNVTIKARKHIVKLVRESCAQDSQRAFESRYRHFVLTEVGPRHWPGDLKDEFSILSDPVDDDRNDIVGHDLAPTDLRLNGVSVTEKRITEICRKSFSEFLTTIEKLEKENESFYKPKLIEEMLRYHIAHAHSAENLVALKNYVESLGRFQDPSIVGSLAEKFWELGDQDNAIVCFGIAYACHYSWRPWKSNAKYLAFIAEKDLEEAREYLLRECYDSVSRSEGGYDTPSIAASGLDVLDDSSLMEAVFDEFLLHCESMFAQLPQDNDHTWLKEYANPAFDENYLILLFSIEELGTEENDLGERLVIALVSLAIARPQSVIPSLISKALSTSGRVLRRLLMILHAIAVQRPNLLVSHQQSLSSLLNAENFFCRQTANCILQYINEISPLEPLVAHAVQRVERKYSDGVSNSTYRFLSKPSPEFSAFFARHTQFDYLDQMNLFERILRVPTGSLEATIEKRFKSQNWSMDEEYSRVRNDWDGRVHPRGWPIVWITTEFQELAMDEVWGILDEAAEKMKLSRDQILWLWQTAQVIDPEYVIRGMVTRPSDIKMLQVVDKDEWIKELDEFEPLQIGDRNAEELHANTITVFERRILAYERESDAPFRQETLLQASLIPIQVYGGTQALDELDQPAERIPPDPSMPITLEQAREILTTRNSATLSAGDGSIPLIARHRNPVSFLGYQNVCTLASYIIDDFGLSFGGFDLTKGGKFVTKYEAWQEGYQTSVYSRDKLSQGVRLQVSLDFLAEICRRYQKMLCIQTDETRMYFKYDSDTTPETWKNSKRYVIYHL